MKSLRQLKLISLTSRLPLKVSRWALLETQTGCKVLATLIKSGALAAFFMPLYPLPTHRFGNLGFNVFVKVLSSTALFLISFDGIEIAICC